MSDRDTLIVDGYNVLRASQAPYAALAERDIDAARTRLVSDVAAYVHGATEAVVVFDAGGNRDSDGTPHEIAGVTVIFSPFGVEADSVIEQLVAARRRTGERVTVVTSDAQTQWTVIGPGVVRLSAAGFAEELVGEQVERDAQNPSGSRSSTLDGRIDPAVSETLARWARGER